MDKEKQTEINKQYICDSLKEWGLMKCSQDRIAQLRAQGQVESEIIEIIFLELELAFLEDGGSFFRVNEVWLMAMMLHSLYSNNGLMPSPELLKKIAKTYEIDPEAIDQFLAQP